MIVLRVLSYNGDPADGPSAQFDEIGGTIGRADNNQLVLPDPERTISRVHARVVFRAGGYAVVDNGSNPISVNGLPVGAGREHPLQPGDQLQIGGYVLGASAATATKSSDPFADLFTEPPQGLAVPARPAAAATQMRTAMPPSPLPPTAMWPAPSAPVPAPRASAPAPALSPGHIPEDWDPFAPDPASSPAAPAPAAPARQSFPTGGGDSLDELFGLSDPPKPSPSPPPPPAMARPNTASLDDALESLSRTATIMPPSRSDHGSELNTPMPRAYTPPPPPPAPTKAPDPTPLPSGAVLSWNDPPRDGRVVTLPGVRRTESAPLPAPLPRPEPAPAPPRSAASAADDGALLSALLAGLDTPGLRLEALTPDTMQLLGQLMRESVRGAVELLVARAALKREMRAEVTMIVSRENNPLKFSPTVEVALQHLLGPPAPGFMPAAAAVRDAFDDLRAHQLGVMAGMRAALEGVLGRFDPQQLEGKLTGKSAINTLIPAMRKARLWELFNELFTQLQTEAQDDFDELFGKAFLRAYEDQLDRLHREPGPR